MADNKTTLTDAEIKKALEDYTDRFHGVIKYVISQASAKEIHELLCGSLDLINRLEADKEALIAGQETLQKALAEKNAEIESITEKFNCQQTVYADLSKIIKDKNAEIERLKNLLEGWKTEAYKVADEKDKLYCEAVERVKTTKSEAIKEFAERLESLKKCRSCITTSEYELSVTMREIDNLVKEMAGDAE